MSLTSLSLVPHLKLISFLISSRPKNCIGMEFGLMEQKIILAMTVSIERASYVPVYS
jgi:hypothetical protein